MRQFALVNVSTGERTQIEQELTVGRRDGDLVVDDAKVSQNHAQIHVDAGELVLTDLESRNGSFVDERRITGSHFLQDGQTIRLGETRWKVEITGALPTEATEVSGGSASDATRISHSPGASPAPAPAPAPVAAAQPRRDAAPAPAPHAAGRVPAYAEEGASNRRASAARSGMATAACYGIVIADAVALGVYFATR